MDPAWSPTPEAAARSNVGRFMARFGDGSFDELRRRSIEDPATFWDQVVEALGLRFTTPYDQVLDESNGVPWATWFTGGHINVADQCADRHVDAGQGDRP